MTAEHACQPVAKSRICARYRWGRPSSGGRVPMLTKKERPYAPSEKEPFMNERQRDYFRERLLSWKDEILAESRETLETLQTESHNHPDYADRASSETDRSI